MATADIEKPALNSNANSDNPAEYAQAPGRTERLTRSTLIVMLAFAVAKVISLAQTFIIANVFGAGREWDAFVTANGVPELIFTLISGGALAHAFIPIFSGYLASEDRAGAWRIASHVINTIFVTTLLVSVVVFLLAPTLVTNWIAPGFDAATQAQTIQLMRILLISTLIFSISGISMGILQSHNRFVLPALAPIMFDLGILFGVAFLIPAFGVYGVAIGAVIGAALHLGVQVPGLIRVRAHWWPELGLRDPVLWRVIRLMLPRVAGLGVFSLNFLVMNSIASRLGEGSVSALSWGWRLMQIPETLIGTAMGTVIFPMLAALSELGDERGKREAMSGALRFILIATIPSAIGLIIVGPPLIRLLERGAFDASASAMVYSTLRFFALGLVVHSALEIVARSFYADKDTLTPLWAALGGAALNLGLSYALSGVNNPDAPNLGVGGLALANSIGTAFEVFVLLWLLRRRWHGANETALGRTIIKTIAASLVMTLAILIIDTLWNALGLADRSLPFIVAQVAIESLVGVAVFIGVALLLKMDEVRTIITTITARVMRRPTQPEGTP
ncbi:MAG: murein biosynthesis integral membrane protein MurJ [Burkholderiales bacterium]|nr:murein biosynthesis integral membrane protein MurJ [Anaerolineae bacterium]